MPTVGRRKEMTGTGGGAGVGAGVGVGTGVTWVTVNDVLAVRAVVLASTSFCEFTMSMAEGESVPMGTPFTVQPENVTDP
jgi:hypothetical protein